MGWLLKNDKEKLKVLVKDAVEGGFVAELDQMNSSDYLNAGDEMHTTIEDFMCHLEDLLIEAVDGVDAQEGERDKLMTAVKKFDGNNLDTRLIWLSMQQAKSQLIKHNRENRVEPGEATDGGEPHVPTNPDANALLFDQILKNWSPSNNEHMN